MVNFAKEVGVEQNHERENATWMDNLYRENVENVEKEQSQIVNSLERYDEECLFLDSRRLIKKRWSLESQLYWVGILRPFRKVSLKWPFVKHQIKAILSNIVKALAVLSTFYTLTHLIFRTALEGGDYYRHSTDNWSTERLSNLCKTTQLSSSKVEIWTYRIWLKNMGS